MNKDTFEELDKKLKFAFESVNKGMEAHLIESIISLFHQGVLRHYVRSPRQTIDPSNFKLTISAANGVKFEGREKLIELEKENQILKEFAKDAMGVSEFYSNKDNLEIDSNDVSWFILEEGTHEQGKRARKHRDSEIFKKAKEIVG